MATKAHNEDYLGSPLSVPYKLFESDFNRALRQKAMVRDADNAVKNYKEVEAETARGQKKPAPKDSTPTAAENERIKKEEADANQDRDNKKGAASGSTTLRDAGKLFAKGGSIRGGGIEQRGKTKGRMV